MLLWLLLTSSACEKDLKSTSVAYQNDFETGDFPEIENAITSTFDGSTVLGNYNNGGPTFNLQGLADHYYIAISFDLYLHDSWDGNSQQTEGPDLFIVEVDDWKDFREITSRERIFQTTFSNSVCNTVKCRLQSFPDRYPTSNFPRTSALTDSLPGLCHDVDDPIGTSKYRFEVTFPHTNAAMCVRIYDELVQTNVPDQLCDESWSLDNLSVELLNLD